MIDSPCLMYDKDIQACCCRCVYHVTITKHPWNDHALIKGRIREKSMYGCTSSDEGNFITPMDRLHSACELFTPRKVNIDTDQLHKAYWNSREYHELRRYIGENFK